MPDFACPKHRTPLREERREDAPVLVCGHGCAFPVLRGVPRFVPDELYASSFGLQWNTFRATQLDSVTGAPISRDRLARILGGLDWLAGKSVLEAGCGAGRFTEVLLEAGASVWSVDLSSAVEANRQNCGRSPRHAVCQADILALPFADGQFQVVICIGVIQHTPDPEQTLAALCRMIAPGGRLFIDCYAPGYPMQGSRRMLRAWLLGKTPAFAMRFCQVMTALLWPLHTMAWRLRGLGLGRTLRGLLLRVSPLVDYHDAYPSLGPKFLREWAMLDTHDTLTDAFKHLRTCADLRQALAANGMIDIICSSGGNGVEATAVKPCPADAPNASPGSCAE